MLSKKRLQQLFKIFGDIFRDGIISSKREAVLYKLYFNGKTVYMQKIINKKLLLAIMMMREPWQLNFSPISCVLKILLSIRGFL